jgi:hypothetical protein
MFLYSLTLQKASGASCSRQASLQGWTPGSLRGGLRVQQHRAVVVA